MSHRPMLRPAPILAALLLCFSLLLSGCGDFFVNTSSTSTTSSGTAIANDYLYVVNPSANTLVGYTVNTNGTTTQIGSYNLPTGFAGATVTVTRGNNYVYAGGPLGIVGYSIGSGGALAALAGGAALSVQPSISLDTSPDGQWLFSLNQSTPTIDEYLITSTGQLSVQGSAIYQQGSVNFPTVPLSVRSSPTGTYVAAALGTGGFVVFPFTTSSGGFGSPLQVSFTKMGIGVNGLAIDPAGAYLYVTQQNGVLSYKLSTLFATSQATPVGPLAAAGAGAASIVINPAGTFLYTGNRTGQNISAFSVANGLLSAVSGTPVAGAANTTPRSLAIDRTGAYLVAGTLAPSTDFTVYSFDATVAGKPAQKSTGSTGTDALGGQVATSH